MSPEDFKVLIKQTAMTRTALADILGITRLTLRKWERGVFPAPKMAIIILKMLVAKRQALITGQTATVEL